jgi:hypothetical protein
MLRKMNVSVFAVAIVLAACGFASAIDVPNFSFESPVTALGYTIDDWSQAGSGQTSGITGNPYGGTTVTNADGSQLAFVASQIGATAGSIYQLLTDTYTAGNSYTLTVGLAKMGAVPSGGLENHVNISLYWDNEGTKTTVGTATRVRLGDQSTTLLTDYSVIIPTVQSSDAFATKAIGIMIAAEAVVGNNCYWNVDNVRLTATPEPGTLALLTTGLIGLVCYAWRKRK